MPIHKITPTPDGSAVPKVPPLNNRTPARKGKGGRRTPSRSEGGGARPESAKSTLSDLLQDKPEAGEYVSLATVLLRQRRESYQLQNLLERKRKEYRGEMTSLANREATLD
ncbi:hypothetical protein KIPB_013377, partial [Kipferlia bialata]|eukprot:g13377.t1